MSTMQGEVVVGYDGSEAADEALRWALDDARRRHLSVELLHAHPAEAVLTSLGFGYYGADERREVEAREILAAGSAKAARWAPDVRVSSCSESRSPSASLTDALPRASLVVTGSRGLGTIESRVVGSTSVEVATHAGVPVVVVRAPQPHSRGPNAGRVVIGVDGQQHDEVLRFGLDEAAMRGVGATVVHAWRSQVREPGVSASAIEASVGSDVLVPTDVESLHGWVAPWRDEFPDVDVREELVHGSTSHVLVAAAEGAELLVVGSRGRGGLESLVLGSVSRAVLHHATCPVAVVHARKPA